MKKTILILSVLLSPLMLPAQEESDLKLDQILSGIERLHAEVQRLEARVTELESQIASRVADEYVGGASLQVTEAAGGTGGSLIDRVVEAVNFREERVNFPWMMGELWGQLEEGMNREEVLAILGEPTMEDPSLKRLIDTVFTYTGRKPSTGERVTGKVRFYKGKVVNIEPPR